MRFQIAALALCSSLAMPMAYGEDSSVKSRMDSAVKATADQLMPMRASQFIGTNIYNMDNASLGEVKDIVLDGGHASISYVAVSYGGLLGIGDKLYAVPYQAFKFRPMDKGKVFLDVSKDTIKDQQGFDEKNWPDLNDPTIRKSMMDTYHVSSEVPNHLRDRASTIRPEIKNENPVPRDADKMAATPGTNTPVKDGLAWNRRWSQLNGADIVNKADEKIGDVYDVVFDAQNGKVSYVVLQYGGVMGIGDKLFAVPANSLSGKHDEEKLVLDISRDRFKNAPGFDQSHWPDFADQSLRNTYDKYYAPTQSTSTQEPQEQR